MKSQFIPPHKADELNKILGLPPREKSPKRPKFRIEGQPDTHADVSDPKVKKFLDDVAGSFDPREW